MPKFLFSYQVETFAAIPPTNYPDDISLSTPDFWPVFEFEALKIAGDRPIPVGHPLIIVKFLGGNALTPWDMSVRKS